MTHPQQPDDRYWDNLTMQRQQQHVPDTGLGCRDGAAPAPTDIGNPISPPPYPIGSVVRLKSGGPAMTVCELRGAHVACIWNRDDNAILDAEFPISVLALVPPAPQASEPDDIVVTEAMEDAGLDAWHSATGMGARAILAVTYRAMRAAAGRA